MTDFDSIPNILSAIPDESLTQLARLFDLLEENALHVQSRLAEANASNPRFLLKELAAKEQRRAGWEASATYLRAELLKRVDERRASAANTKHEAFLAALTVEEREEQVEKTSRFGSSRTETQKAVVFSIGGTEFARGVKANGSWWVFQYREGPSQFYPEGHWLGFQNKRRSELSDEAESHFFGRAHAHLSLLSRGIAEGNGGVCPECFEGLRWEQRIDVAPPPSSPLWELPRWDEASPRRAHGYSCPWVERHGQPAEAVSA